MKEELMIIKNELLSMEDIINAVPGERFTLKNADTVVIIMRRMEKSDLKNALEQYTEIFSRNDKVTVMDITRSAVAVIKIRILIEAEAENLDAVSTRNLIKAYKARISKVINIIKLSKVNAMSASSYEKEKIEVTVAKNESFLEAYEREIEVLEKMIERMPKVAEEPAEESSKKEEPHSEKKEVAVKPTLVKAVRKIVDDKNHSKEVDKELKAEEVKISRTRCAEIPYYDTALSFTESFVCKDIPAFTILKKKNNIYFGKTANIKGKIYDNKDVSLLELTEATEDFIQYMTEDLLGENYDLVPFKDVNLDALNAYFEFINFCFEKYIGFEISVREYLEFKEYFNELIERFFELENQYKGGYYRALEQADLYMDYMSAYDMVCTDTKEVIIKKILSGEIREFVSDLDLIIDCHVVSGCARRNIIELIKCMEEFWLVKKDGPDTTNMELDKFLKALEEDGAKVIVQRLNEFNNPVDEAVFMPENYKNAILLYQNVGHCVLGVRCNGTDTFFEV